MTILDAPSISPWFLLLMMVGEKCQRRSQETPISFRGGIVNVTNGGGRAAEGQNPQNHRGVSSSPSPSRQMRGVRRGHTPPSRRRGGRRCQRQYVLIRVHLVEMATATQHGPNWSVAKSSDGRRVRARGHDNSRGWRHLEIDQSRRVLMARKSRQEGTMIAMDGGDDNSWGRCQGKKGKQKWSGIFFF